MEHFDTLTMSYMSTPMPLQSGTGPDQQLALPMVPLEHYNDQRSTYDAETFAGCAARRPCRAAC